MNKHLTLLAAAIATSFATSQAMAAPTAEQLVGTTHLTGFVDYVTANDDLSDAEGALGDGTGVGLNLGYRINELWGFRSRYEYLDINRHGGFSNATGDAFGVDALLFPSAAAYLALGVRNVDLTDADSEIVGNLGLGYNFFLNNNVSISPEVNALLGDTTLVTTGVGINYHFGVKEPVKAEPAPVVAAVAAPVDSDGDGVTDDKDACADTPKGDKVDEKGCTIFAEEKKSVRLEVLFANDSAVVPENSYHLIQAVADFMKKYPHTEVTIEGHTSAPGSAKHNLKLSQERADAVASVLVTRFGIDGQRVKSIGYGEDRLLTKEKGKKADALNRRVEAVLEVTENYSVKK